MPSFTARIPNLRAAGPVVQIEIGPSRSAIQAMQSSGQGPSRESVVAMIDTGATSSVIQTGLAQQLDIHPVGSITINTPSSHGVVCDEYAIAWHFPQNVNAEGTAIEAPLQGQHIQALIGRDILAHGLLVYTGYDNSFTLAF